MITRSKKRTRSPSFESDRAKNPLSKDALSRDGESLKEERHPRVHFDESSNKYYKIDDSNRDADEDEEDPEYEDLEDDYDKDEDDPDYKEEEEEDDPDYEDEDDPDYEDEENEEDEEDLLSE